MNTTSGFLKYGYYMLERQLKTIRQGFCIKTYKERGKTKNLNLISQVTIILRNLLKWLNNSSLHLPLPTLILLITSIM